MGKDYLWNAGSAAFAAASSWIDLATGASAVVAPGSLDSASIGGPSSGVLVVSGSSGGMLALFGDVAGGGVLEVATGATLLVAGSVAATTGLSLAAGGVLEMLGGDCAGSITGLADGGTIDFASISLSGVAWTANGNGGGTLTPKADGAGDDPISLVPCFMAGTRIATPAGEVTVEALRPGDRVLTPSGPRPVRWIGRRGYAAPVVARNGQLRPVHIRTNALADGVPRRDLLVSPQHALFLDGWLVLAVALVNGASITRAADGPVRYFHLELDRHDVLLAEGAPAESFFDGGHRDLFHTGIGRPCPALRPCAPRLEGGFRLAALRRRLAVRAGLPLPSPRPPGTLRGHVERIVPAPPGLRVDGWALDVASSDRPLELEVRCDGGPPLPVLADICRPRTA